MLNKESKTASISKLENKNLENNASKLIKNQPNNLLNEIQNFHQNNTLKKPKSNEKTDEKVDKNNNQNDFAAEMRQKIKLRRLALNKYHDNDDE